MSTQFQKYHTRTLQIHSKYLWRTYYLPIILEKDEINILQLQYYFKEVALTNRLLLQTRLQKKFPYFYFILLLFSSENKSSSKTPGSFWQVTTVHLYNFENVKTVWKRKIYTPRTRNTILGAGAGKGRPGFKNTNWAQGLRNTSWEQRYICNRVTIYLYICLVYLDSSFRNLIYYLLVVVAVVVVVVVFD